ncbi:hypothetical protein HYC85_005239 [Camellia sinensis]|uniref:Uncharacterized protein n=1 Tax=Camellia sinensis TaxID=4442 RepID=A0A7J7I0T4_CAMSI|nr:hypothetical protein HYC85_005239 [Camellia sinensis]
MSKSKFSSPVEVERGRDDTDQGFHFSCIAVVGLAMVVVESAVTSIYICYAEDPSLIHRWDAEFFNQMTETLHRRLQHRSARAREVLSHGGLDARFEETVPV